MLIVVFTVYHSLLTAVCLIPNFHTLQACNLIYNKIDDSILLSARPGI